MKPSLLPFLAVLFAFLVPSAPAWGDDDLSPAGTPWAEYCQTTCDAGCEQRGHELRCGVGPSNAVCTSGSMEARVACCIDRYAEGLDVEGCDGNRPRLPGPATGQQAVTTGNPAAVRRTPIPGLACREAGEITQELAPHERVLASSCTPPIEGRDASFFDVIRLPAAGETPEEAFSRLDFANPPLSELRPLVRLYEQAPRAQKPQRLQNLLRAASTRLLLERKRRFVSRSFAMTQAGDSTLEAHLLALRARIEMYEQIARAMPAGERPEWAIGLIGELRTLRTRLIQVERLMRDLKTPGRNYLREQRLALARAIGQIFTGCPEWVTDCTPQERVGSIEGILLRMGEERVPATGSDIAVRFANNTNAIRESALGARAILRGEVPGNTFHADFAELNQLSDCRFATQRIEALRPLAERKVASCQAYCRRTGAELVVTDGRHSCARGQPVVSDAESNGSPDDPVEAGAGSASDAQTAE